MDYYSFHDRDVAPEGATVQETEAYLDAVVAKLEARQAETGIGVLFGSCDLFSHHKYMHGAATNPDPRIVCHAAAQIEKMIQVTKRLGGENFCLWGGRDGYASLLNTKLGLELDHYARFLGLVARHAAEMGFKGQLLLEPKPREPTSHQYQYDAATTLGFLDQYGLFDAYTLNLEAHAHPLALTQIGPSIPPLRVSPPAYPMLIPTRLAQPCPDPAQPLPRPCPTPAQPLRHCFFAEILPRPYPNPVQTLSDPCPNPAQPLPRPRPQANHSTLAGHSAEHDVAVAAARGKLGSLDVNRNESLLGWDTDMFATDLSWATYVMKAVIEKGGLAPGGLNFDAKVRRESTDIKDLFVSHVSAMDCMARGLRAAAALIDDGTFGGELEGRYARWDNSQIGQDFQKGRATLADLAAVAKEAPVAHLDVLSGKQETFEAILGRFAYGSYASEKDASP